MLEAGAKCDTLSIVHKGTPVRFTPALLLLLASFAPVWAAPSSVGAAAGKIGDVAQCEQVRKRFDADRLKMELLMTSLQKEDGGAESPARFKRMCAIDKAISDSAKRLGAMISGSGKTCLSAEDRAQGTQMRHLSQPVPECARAGASTIKKAQAAKPAKKASLVVAQATPDVSKAKRPRRVSTPVAAQPGLMADLY
jgi:hypothetical protein